MPPDASGNLDRSSALGLVDGLRLALRAAQKAERVLRRRLGTGFRIAGYVARRETDLNRVLADLLDPSGPHGQGAAFLESFLRLVLPEAAGGRPGGWQVIVNYRTKNGRYVDIALLRGLDVAIYIESKPWAPEGDAQLDDYAQDLLGSGAPRKRLVWLPGTADRTPASLSVRLRDQLGDVFVKLPFARQGNGRSVIEWLEACASGCEADNVRLFLRDLADWADDEFPGHNGVAAMADDPFLAMIRDDILGDGERLRIVLKLSELIPGLKISIASRFFDELQEVVFGKLACEVERYETFLKRGPWITFRKKGWPAACGITIEAEQGSYKSVALGFRWNPKPEPGSEISRAQSDEIFSALRAPLSRVNDPVRRWPVAEPLAWPAYVYLPDRYAEWTDETFLLLADERSRGEAVELWAGWITDLLQACEATVDGIVARMQRDEVEAPGAPPAN